ncbi:MAG: ATP-binding protein, partial [SAR202 cluster bacterium]|nr:ATP-binding protein [SAR202 cluster bacterium]
MTQSGQTGWNFAGRQRELADLKAALYSAVAGQGQLVMLAGEQAGHPDKTA